MDRYSIHYKEEIPTYELEDEGEWVKYEDVAVELSELKEIIGNHECFYCIDGKGFYYDKPSKRWRCHQCHEIKLLKKDTD